MKPLLLSVAALAMAAAVSAAAPDPPAVVFNHFYVVVDAESYRAIQASSFMTGQLAHLRALGWAIQEEAGDVLANGPDVRLRIRPATTERRGVTEVELSLQAVPAASSQQRFGAAQATVERARGVLRFGAAKTGVR